MKRQVYVQKKYGNPHITTRFVAIVVERYVRADADVVWWRHAVSLASSRLLLQVVKVYASLYNVNASDWTNTSDHTHSAVR